MVSQSRARPTVRDHCELAIAQDDGARGTGRGTETTLGRDSFPSLSQSSWVHCSDSSESRCSANSLVATALPRSIWCQTPLPCSSRCAHLGCSSPSPRYRAHLGVLISGAHLRHPVTVLISVCSSRVLISEVLCSAHLGVLISSAHLGGAVFSSSRLAHLGCSSRKCCVQLISVTSPETPGHCFQYFGKYTGTKNLENMSYHLIFGDILDECIRFQL